MEENKKPSNPMAFPDPMRGGETNFINQNPRDNEEGITYKDYAATRAMQAMVSTISNDADYLRIKSIANSEGRTVSEWISKESYKQANAMLAEREKNL